VCVPFVVSQPFDDNDAAQNCPDAQECIPTEDGRAGRRRPVPLALGDYGAPKFKEMYNTHTAAT